MVEKQETIDHHEIKLEGYDFNYLFDRYKSGKMAILIADMTRRCNLRCIYCSTGAGKIREGEMSKEVYFDLLEKSRRLGAETLSIEGEGEPLLDPKLIPVLKKAQALGMKSVVFTNGTLINRDKANKFNELGVAFVVKLNALNQKVHDYLTGVPGSYKKARRGLETLIDCGFNTPRVDEKTGNLYTKLGIEAIICRSTLEEIPGLVKFAKGNNLYPILDMIEYEGRATGDFFSKQMITGNQNRELFDQVRGVMGYPFFGPIGPQCPQLISFNVSNTGEVKVSTCGESCSIEPGRLVGNIQERSVSDLYKEVRALREKSNLTESIESGLLTLEGYEMFPYCPIQVRLLQLHSLPHQS